MPKNPSRDGNIYARLMGVIEDRKRQPLLKSYTNTLLKGGVRKIGEKVIEEAAELVSAAEEPGDEGKKHLIHESADVLYHVLVMLAYRDVPLGAVEAELERRFGVSGLDEKASRASGGGQPG
jgi:phosphoribosyl-ATP pyrophosphohydrolase